MERAKDAAGRVEALLCAARDGDDILVCVRACVRERDRDRDRDREGVCEREIR